jgi:ATP adenylyltransferase
VERLWAPWRLEYVQHADEQDGCVFCRAAAGDDEEQLVVHRGKNAFVLLNRFPYASGHMMVAPYRHGVTFETLADVEALEVHHLAVQAIGVLGSLYGSEGFNVGWNLGRIAGAGIVDHGHVHVVPRWGGDTNFMPVLADVRVIPEHLIESRRRLAEAWPLPGAATPVPETVSGPGPGPEPEAEPAAVPEEAPAARNGGDPGELESGEMLERRSGTDRRSGVDRRLRAQDSAASRVISFLGQDRRADPDRRSGLERRSPEPALERVRRR